MRFVEISSIKSLGVKPVFDLSMADNEDPSFVANDFVVHNSAESAYSTFLETQNSYREDLTDRIFYSKLFPLIAVSNGLYKDPSKRAKANEIVDFLFNRNNRANLKMPQIHWEKSLEAKGEDNMAELLELASQKGVPVPLKMWLAATHIDPEGLVRDLEEDREFRERLAKFTGKDTSHEGEEDMEFDDGDDEDRGSVDRSKIGATLKGPITSQSMSKLVHGLKVPLLAREFGNSDTFKITKTGKIKHVPSAVTAARKNAMNDMILKIAREVDKDPNYAESLKKRNKEKLGRTTLPK